MLPPELRALRQRALARREQIAQMRQACEERAQCIRLIRGQWYRLPLLAGLLGIDRMKLYRRRDQLTTKKTDDWGGCYVIQADEKLLELGRSLFISIHLTNC